MDLELQKKVSGFTKSSPQSLKKVCNHLLSIFQNISSKSDLASNNTPNLTHCAYINWKTGSLTMKRCIALTLRF